MNASPQIIIHRFDALFTFRNQYEYTQTQSKEGAKYVNVHLSTHINLKRLLKISIIKPVRKMELRVVKLSISLVNTLVPSFIGFIEVLTDLFPNNPRLPQCH